MKLRLSKRNLRRWGVRLGLALLLVGGGGYGLYRLGVYVTPAGSPPVIYSPAVRRTENYRRQARAWLDQLQRLDARLVPLLADSQPDVYALSQAAQEGLADAAALSQAISLAYPPASLVSVRDGLQETADLYLEAAALLNRWVGEPTVDLYLETLEALRVARATRAVVAENPWLRADPPPASSRPEAISPLPEVPLPHGTPQWGE